MYGSLQETLEQQLEEIRRQGLYKTERVITSPRILQAQV